MLKDSNEADFYELTVTASGRLSPGRISNFFWATFIYDHHIGYCGRCRLYDVRSGCLDAVSQAGCPSFTRSVHR